MQVPRASPRGAGGLLKLEVHTSWPPCSADPPTQLTLVARWVLSGALASHLWAPPLRAPSSILFSLSEKITDTVFISEPLNQVGPCDDVLPPWFDSGKIPLLDVISNGSSRDVKGVGDVLNAKPALTHRKRSAVVE